MPKTTVNFAAGSSKRPRKKATSKVIFGAVSVKTSGQEADVVSRNVRTGQSAFRRAANKIVVPGISIRPKRSVPLYYADDAHPGSIVRELDGQKVLGLFKDGKFVVSNG